ncbi:polyadenylate-binding protein-interacting protein 2 isoform X1 [Pituophis catenifer annectens]|uniref:polyadenylate-binding protein-interacting protein 2 isoform X1 n=1 Tax=Pituophis catenifer annectens TaxID=94852 RepID=UPI0039912DA3
MKDPSRRSTSPSIISEDMIMNGHSHEDDNPFAEYMWMENEEEFNRQIEEELWEEEFIERCFQEMLEEEEEHEWFIPARDLPQTMDQIQDQFNDLVISDSSSLEDLVVFSEAQIPFQFPTPKNISLFHPTASNFAQEPLVRDIIKGAHCV